MAVLQSFEPGSNLNFQIKSWASPCDAQKSSTDSKGVSIYHSAIYFSSKKVGSANHVGRRVLKSFSSWCGPHCEKTNYIHFCCWLVWIWRIFIYVKLNQGSLFFCMIEANKDDPRNKNVNSNGRFTLCQTFYKNSNRYLFEYFHIKLNENIIFFMISIYNYLRSLLKYWFFPSLFRINILR